MKRNSRKRAFTLLEVLMVVVIIGVLAVVVISQLGGVGDRARQDLAQTAVSSTLPQKIELFKMHTGRYPTGEEGLAVLIEAPSDEEVAEKWSGPYLDKKQIKDPWGREYQYNYPGEYNERTFDLSSSGPDGVEGNEDDITNWEKA